MRNNCEETVTRDKDINYQMIIIVKTSQNLYFDFDWISVTGYTRKFPI
jgi:hypothetical protein